MAGTAKPAAKGRKRKPFVTDWQPELRLFTADEYLRMAESGILAEDDHIELIEGIILQMSPIGSKHVGCVHCLNRWFTARLNGQAIVSVQCPVLLAPRSEPEPDLVLLRDRPDFYRSALPGPEDVLLLFEVADSSLAYDRGVKLRLYAEAGIAEYWIVDLNSEQVIVCREPRSTDGTYSDIRVCARGSSITPIAYRDLALEVDTIFG